MTLDPQAKYPSIRSYVLKLHRDCLPEPGRIFGRLENIVTGRQSAFGSADELLALLASDLDAAQPDSGI